MKWTFLIQQKVKLATLLFSLMLLVVLFNIMEQRNIAEMNRSVESIYNDRLIPATDIFYLTDNLYSKRVLIEKFLDSDKGNVLELKRDINVHNKNIDRLIRQFEKTYLVEKEGVFLNDFKTKVNQYSLIEKKIIGLAEKGFKPDALLLYDTKGKHSLMLTIQKLSDLAKIQTLVGWELLTNTQRVLANSDLLSSLQMILSIGIGLLVISLITSSKAVSKTEKNFHLN